MARRSIRKRRHVTRHDRQESLSREASDAFFAIFGMRLEQLDTWAKKCDFSNGPDESVVVEYPDEWYEQRANEW